MPTNVGTFTVFGAIEQKWLSLGGVGGLLGAPLSNESPTFDGAGRAQTFQKGIVSWHPTIGAHEVMARSSRDGLKSAGSSSAIR